MGSWNETCAVTNLPIFEGEKCVMLVFEHTLLDTTDRFMDTLVDNFMHSVCTPELIHKGKYNDYGYIDNAPALKPIPKNNDKSKPSDYPIVFVRNNVWSQLVKKYKNDEETIQFINLYKLRQKEPSGEFLRELTDLRIEYLIIKKYLGSIRKSIFGGLVGRGSPEQEINPYKEMIKLTEKEIVSLKKRQDKIDRE